jgi:mannose-6-phosphate isomerase-like protein (cupin superfamily)
MQPPALIPIDIKQETNEVNSYKNIPLSIVNDHTVRLSIMTEPFYWHYHPNSDETFLSLEGVLCIDLEDKTIELSPNQLITIPANVAHRTRPKSDRSINVTFEREGIETVKLDK